TRFKCDWSSDVCSSDLVVDDVLELLCAQAAGVEQRVAFRGRAVADEAFALRLQLANQLRQLRLDALHTLRERGPRRGFAEVQLRSEERRVGTACRAGGG